MMTLYPRFVSLHVNLTKIGKHTYVKIPRILKDMMELCNSEPLHINYDDKIKQITIRKEKGVTAA